MPRLGSYCAAAGTAASSRTATTRGPVVSDAAVRFSEYGTSAVLRIGDLLGGLGSVVAGTVDQIGEA